MNAKFWYPTFPVEVQEFLPGMEGQVTQRYEAHMDVEGHIVLSEGKLICGGNKNKILEKTNAPKSKTVEKPLAGIGLCKKCMKGYKGIWMNELTKLENWEKGIPIS